MVLLTIDTLKYSGISGLTSASRLLARDAAATDSAQLALAVSI